MLELETTGQLAGSELRGQFRALYVVLNIVTTLAYYTKPQLEIHKCLDLCCNTFEEISC